MNTNFKTIIKEKSRMCKTYETCLECCLTKNMEEYNFQDCNEYMISDPDLFLSDMNKWMSENPRKTNSDLFRYKFKNRPWAEKNADGFIRCGYFSNCEEMIPCSDCPWWFEPKDAEWDEKKYEMPVKSESKVESVEKTIEADQELVEDKNVIENENTVESDLNDSEEYEEENEKDNGYIDNEERIDEVEEWEN